MLGSAGSRAVRTGRPRSRKKDVHCYLNWIGCVYRGRAFSFCRAAGLSFGFEARAGRSARHSTGLRCRVRLVARMVWFVFTNPAHGASIKPAFEFKSTAISALNFDGMKSEPGAVATGS